MIKLERAGGTGTVFVNPNSVQALEHIETNGQPYTIIHLGFGELNVKGNAEEVTEKLTRTGDAS